MRLMLYQRNEQSIPRLAARRRTRRVLATIVASVAALLMLALISGCTPEATAALKTYSGINAIRTQAGLPPLAVDESLAEVARIRSHDMATRDYFAHEPPDGCNAFCIMRAQGIGYAWAGENLELNNWDWPDSADGAVRTWRNSPEHLANILNCHYTRFGAGVEMGADRKIYFTMIFEGDAAC